MKHKIKKLLTLTYVTKKKSPKMQFRLALYWLSGALALFGVFVLFLGFGGFFKSTEKELSRSLKICENNIIKEMEAHIEILEAQAIDLSKNASSVIKKDLLSQPVSSLNNDIDGLTSLQKNLFPIINKSLSVSPCSGAFVSLDATVNTSSPNADISRSGIYLRFSHIGTTKSATQPFSLFRGSSQLADEESISMHNRWNLEFDMSRFPEINSKSLFTNERLAENCLWSRRSNLPDTWENVIYLFCPLVAQNGVINGLCGFEISDLYFSFAYPAISGDFGKMTTILAPIDKTTGKISLEKGIIGGFENSDIDLAKELTITKGKLFYTYESESLGQRFLGVHKSIPLKSVDNSHYVVATLIPESNLLIAMEKEKTTMILGLLLFIAIMLIIAIYLSKRFINPILNTFDAIKSSSFDTSSPKYCSEIDDLFCFLSEKDKQYEKEKTDMQRKKAAAEKKASLLASQVKTEIDPNEYKIFINGLTSLTPTEHKVFDYYISGKSAKEIMELTNIKESTLRYHNKNIYSKLGVHSLKQMLILAEKLKSDSKEKENK